MNIHELLELKILMTANHLFTALVLVLPVEFFVFAREVAMRLLEPARNTTTSKFRVQIKRMNKNLHNNYC
jgi:hypothetical protein